MGSEPIAVEKKVVGIIEDESKYLSLSTGAYYFLAMAVKGVKDDIWRIKPFFLLIFVNV